jgi:DNA invertase Pin-like site-specific DNA recombinase
MRDKAMVASTMTSIGYARIASSDGNLEIQARALREAGCEIVFAEIGNGNLGADLPELANALRSLGPGDELVVATIDRLSRDPAALDHCLSMIESLGTTLRLLNDPKGKTLRRLRGDEDLPSPPWSNFRI